MSTTTFTPSKMLLTFKNDFIAAMKLANVTHARIYYSGGGDEGGFDDINVFANQETFDRGEPTEAALLGVAVPEGYRWDNKSEITVSWREAGSAMHDIVIDEYGMTGYWNDDGGEGTIVINALAGTIELTHGSTYTTTEYTDYDPI